ncbi:alpha/beta hydrolase [Sulfitobacter aestuariivivens]|uniref:Alpha/beta hydrolase n=1 Tax=Sulfitobacter aestuariivivens TaxID=2766981 RepID=A0A927D5H3_9RHOB|nr:alpha/beta hydrolase [Sulfitobacter aestuariivivens]MBD3664184.1 alpha/beta hydrolase [Sulfitobacter aestuariivivens]
MAITHYQGLSEKPHPGRPLVFAFHGTGGDENQFYGLAQQLVPGGGVISPRGDVSEMGAARFFKRTGEGVYDMDDLAARTQKMVEYVEAHKRDIPDTQVFGFGYSNGANILASVVMARPDLFDRVALLHPLITWDPGRVDGLAKTPVLISAGRHDPIALWDRTTALIEWFEKQDAAVTVEAHEGGHELRQSEIEALAAFLSE